MDWLISQACEEFHCLPSQVLREDADRVLNIMALRNYARAKVAVETAQDEDGATEWQKAVVFEVVEAITQRASGRAEI